MSQSPVQVKYTYAVIEMNTAGQWFAQNNENPNDPVKLGPDNRLSDILAHFGDEGFIIATSGGIADNGIGPTRLVLARAEFGPREPEVKDSPFLGVDVLQGEQQ